MRTLILAALAAALFAVPAHAQLTPGPLKLTAEDCVGCSITNVQPPPIGGGDGCTTGPECDFVPSIETGPNQGEQVESPCWLLICLGGDGDFGLPPPVSPVICGMNCQVYNDVEQPAPDPEPAPEPSYDPPPPADPLVAAEPPYYGCDWTYCYGTGRMAT